MATVTGSLSWFETQGDIGLILKIYGVDYPGAAKLDMTPEPFTVSEGFLVIEKLPYPVSGSFPCDDRPTGFCGGYRLPTSVVLFDSFGSSKLSVGFNRQRGGLDIVLPLDTRPAVATNPLEYSPFMRCISAIVARARVNGKKGGG
jgi:hypothetical protein